MKIAIAALLGLMLTAPPDVFGHADIDKQVAEVTALIDEEPDDPELYHRRAGLHGAHREYELALADYDRAIDLAPEHVGAIIGRSTSLLKLGRPAEALTAADRAITLAPDNPAPHLARARALAGLGKTAAADGAYGRSTERACQQ